MLVCWSDYRLMMMMLWMMLMMMLLYKVTKLGRTLASLAQTETSILEGY